MEDIQAEISINYISDISYNESDMQLILQNIFGSNYNNFSFNITEDNKVIMDNCAVLINGQIYLFKNGLDITDIVNSMPAGDLNRINVFLIYDYDYNEELGVDVVSNPRLSLTNESGGGQITAPVGFFTKNSDGSITWTNEIDEQFNNLVKSTLAGEVIEAGESGWNEGDIVTFKDNILKYKRFNVYTKNKSTGALTMDLLYGVGTDKWDYETSIRLLGMYTNGNDVRYFIAVFDNYVDEVGGEEVNPNQVRIRNYISYVHNRTGQPHVIGTQNNTIYKIVAKRY